MFSGNVFGDPWAPKENQPNALPGHHYGHFPTQDNRIIRALSRVPQAPETESIRLRRHIGAGPAGKILMATCEEVIRLEFF
jgi:hypothetical protein